MNILTAASEPELHPHEDPDVLRLQVALESARRTAEPAQQAWHAYCVAHADEAGVPFRREKQRLYETFCDTAEAVETAETALRLVMETATARATATWDDRIRQQFLDDLPTIEQFIAVLAQHEATVQLAQHAGVTRALNVPIVFLTVAEVRTRLAYASTQLGIEA